jgi:hypothetical protein
MISNPNDQQNLLDLLIDPDETLASISGLDRPAYDNPIYSVNKHKIISLTYTYDNPDEQYTVSGPAIPPVVRRLTGPALIQLHIEAEILRYAVQQEIGRRGSDFCKEVDQAASRYFQVGKQIQPGKDELANYHKPVTEADLDDVEEDLGL